MIQYLKNSRSINNPQLIYNNRIYWYSHIQVRGKLYVCSNKSNNCKGTLLLKNDMVIKTEDHSCISLSDYAVTVSQLESRLEFLFEFLLESLFYSKVHIRFDELKTYLKDLTSTEGSVHDIWKEYHKNLSAIDLIPSKIVDELVKPWSKVWRQRQHIYIVYVL